MHCSKLIYSLLASVSLVFAPSANGAVNLNLTTSISGGKNIGPGYLNLTAIANSYASSGGGIQVGPYSLNFTMPNGSTIYANLGPSKYLH